MSQWWNCTAVVRLCQRHHSVSVLRSHLTINGVYFPGWNHFLDFCALGDQFPYWKPHWRMQINLICGCAFPSLLHQICFTVWIWRLKTSEYASGAPVMYWNTAAGTIVPGKKRVLLQILIKMSWIAGKADSLSYSIGIWTVLNIYYEHQIITHPPGKNLLCNGLGQKSPLFTR